MKRLLAVALLLLSVSSVASAAQIAALLGYRSNSAVGDNLGTTTLGSRTSAQYGGLLVFSLLDVLAIRTGIVVANRDLDVSTAGVTTTLKTTYLDIPLDAEIMIPATGLYFFGGVKYGIKSSGTCDGLAGCTNDMGNDLVLNVGPGFNFINLEAFKLGIEVEYEHGLSNVQTTGSSSIYTRAFTGNVLATFGF